MASLPSPNSTASFWHSEPSDFLIGHRTTSDLPNQSDVVDVVIVGSGITGASAARYLAEDERAKGYSIVMLEAREACWGATGRNGGHCQPLLFDSTPDVAAFELRNYHTMKSFIENNNVQCEWRSLAGCRTFWTKELALAAAQDVQKLKHDAPELGKEVKVVDDEQELRQLRVNGAAAATHTATAASLWPYKLVAFMLEKLVKEEKLNLQTKTAVTSIQPDKHLPFTLVHTDRGTISAKHVILATNAYTSHLLPEFEDLIVPERGVMTALIPPKGSDPLEHSYGFVGAMGNDAIHDDYLVQRPFTDVPNPVGHLMFGGGHVKKKFKMIGETDDSVLDDGCTSYLRESLLKLLLLGGDKNQGLTELKATHEWSGIWGTSKDGYPWVGEIPGRPGVFLAGGYSGHGMPNGTLCGKAVVEMILGPKKNGLSIADVQERLIRDGNLPQSYIVSASRMQCCRLYDSVQRQHRRGEVGARKLP